MKPLVVLTGLLLALTAPAGLGTATAAPPRPATTATVLVAANTVEVTLDQRQITAVVGERLRVESRIVNRGTAPTERLVAHLNVASLDSGVYVDLEDWSADVTREVAPLATASSTALSWEFQAVNAGSFDVYVVVLPGGASAGSGPLVASPPLHVTVAGKRTLTAGGSLPVAIVVPILLGAVAAASRYRVRSTG